MMASYLTQRVCYWRQYYDNSEATYQKRRSGSHHSFKLKNPLVVVSNPKYNLQKEGTSLGRQWKLGKHEFSINLTKYGFGY